VLDAGATTLPMRPPPVDPMTERVRAALDPQQIMFDVRQPR